jgi:phage/plasmid-like protein (TIGR03299 family)
MSHQFETGFFVRKPAWHGLGTVIGDYPGSVDAALQLAGADWPVQERDVFMRGTDGESLEALDGHKALVRGDTGTVLSVMNRTYTMVQNRTVFEIAEAILKAGEQAKRPVQFETAGVLDEGRRVWALVDLGNQELPGDPSQHTAYMAVLTSHDGTAALRAIGTNVRVVCANTEHAADMEAKAKGTAYLFHHTRNVSARVDDARNAIAGVFGQLDKVYARARHLLAQHVTAAQRHEFVQRFAIERTLSRKDLKRAELEEAMAKPSVINAVNATAAQLETILNSQTCRGIDTTAYGLTQSAVEYIDYVRKVKGGDEALFTRTVLGEDSATVKRLAHTIADDVVAGKFEITNPRLVVAAG